VFGGVDPRRAKDLRDRRERYERRARSIRYGTVRAGSSRHLLQALWRSLTDLRRPPRVVLLVAAVGSVCCAAAGLGAGGDTQQLVALVAIPSVLLVVGVVTWTQETLQVRRTPGRSPLVSPPERPARRARQGS